MSLYATTRRRRWNHKYLVFVLVRSPSWMLTTSGPARASRAVPPTSSTSTYLGLLKAMVINDQRLGPTLPLLDVATRSLYLAGVRYATVRLQSSHVLIFRVVPWSATSQSRSNAEVKLSHLSQHPIAKSPSARGESRTSVAPFSVATGSEQRKFSSITMALRRLG